MSVSVYLRSFKLLGVNSYNQRLTKRNAGQIGKERSYTGNRSSQTAGNSSQTGSGSSQTETGSSQTGSGSSQRGSGSSQPPGVGSKLERETLRPDGTS